MLKTIAINVLELVTAGASTYAGVKFIEHRQNTNEFEDFKADQRKREKQLKDRYTQELGAKEEQMKELEMQLSLFEMDENERIKQFKRLEAEKLQKLAQSIIESHLEASTAKLNNFMASLSDRLIAAEFILADMAIDLNQLENSKKEQRALEDLAVKIVADDVDALGRNYCSMDALKKDFTSLTPLIRQYNIQKESHFSLGTYLCSFLLSKAMFTDVPTNKNDVFHHIKTALDSGQLILALRLYQTLQGWPRMILRDWADRCYTRLECIQEIQVNIKWNGKAIENVEACQGEEISVLKRVIEETCGVPSKKQKLLFKGKFLKDNDVLSDKMFEQGQTIMLMGSAESTDVASHLDPSKLEHPASTSNGESTEMFLPTGLKNLGNTCYVNSSLQVMYGLHKSTGLFDSLSTDAQADNLEPLTHSFNSVLKSLDKKEESVSPLDFILKLRLKFPQYAEKDKYGLFIQHDVHEFWTSFLAYLTNSSTVKLPVNSSIMLEKKNADGDCSFESVGSLLLPVTAETALLDDCLKKCLIESSFANVPSFLSFVFLRFMWKTNEKVQAKILKLVAYPKTFDILSHCNEAMKEEIKAKRVDNPEYGNYKLSYLITHTGREADSGHYMAWSRSSIKASDDWFKFDDDKVSLVKEEEIMKLGGGGDRPTAYMIVYLPAWN